MSKKNKSYDIYVKVEVETTVSVAAQSYEEAIEKARELEVKDIVEFDTERINCNYWNL